MSHRSSCGTLACVAALAAVSCVGPAAGRDQVEAQRARDELASAVEGALDGVLEIDLVLDRLRLLAELPIEPEEDVAYDDAEVRAYRLLGAPEGVRAHVLVGREPFHRHGEHFEFVQLDLELAAGGDPVPHRGALREGPRIHLTLDYDRRREPGALAVILQRDVALRASRAAGIDARSGRFTTGAGLRANFHPVLSVHSGTFGLVDGRTLHGADFGGVSPLSGDVEPSLEGVRALLAVLLRRRAQAQ